MIGGLCCLHVCELTLHVAGGAAALASFRVRSLSRSVVYRQSVASVQASEASLLAEEDKCELEAKHRQLQMNLQVGVLVSRVARESGIGSPAVCCAWQLRYQAQCASWHRHSASF